MQPNRRAKTGLLARRAEKPPQAAHSTCAVDDISSEIDSAMAAKHGERCPNVTYGQHPFGNRPPKLVKSLLSPVRAFSRQVPPDKLPAGCAKLDFVPGEACAYGRAGAT